ncbi:MAG TPA: hypothetical protein VFD41_11545 [Actinomycetales bacterium]|nr:hypothetical protein [Actinomycetales bacterium]
MTISTAAVVQPVDPADDDVETMTLAELRARRRRLLDEAPRVAHWRRLAQARLDLAVADALSGDVWAPTSHGDASSWRTLVLGEVDVGSEDVAVRLRRLDEAGRSLRAYDAEVRQQLAASTQELVRRYHAEPSACLAAVPRDA